MSSTRPDILSSIELAQDVSGASMGRSGRAWPCIGMPVVMKGALPLFHAPLSGPALGPWVALCVHVTHQLSTQKSARVAHGQGNGRTSA